jgi:hypothetical protein
MIKRGRKIIDLTGVRFGRLVVLSYDKIFQKKAYWNVKCDCGKLDTARSDRLRQGRKKSCGCLYIEQRLINIGESSSTPEKVMKYEKSFHVILNLALEQENDEFINIIVNTLRGLVLSDEYEEDALEGLEFYNQFD